MWSRIQVSFTAEGYRRARARAAQMGISFAGYVRRLVARDLGETSGGAEPQELFDLGDSGGSDVARHKDGYVGAAAEAAD